MSAKQILIIEDDRPFQKIMKTALLTKNYQVATCDNGTEGELLVKEMQPDLVLLDVMLPGKTGLDICESLKQDPDYKDIPIIMLTCLTAKSEKNDAYWQKQTLADDFITKPFPMGELLRRVAQVMS